MGVGAVASDEEELSEAADFGALQLLLFVEGAAVCPEGADD